MVTTESAMENESETPIFLLMVLEQGSQLLQEGSVTDQYKDQVESAELVEDARGELETFLGFT